MNLARRSEEEATERRKKIHTHLFLETAVFGYKILKTFSNHANTYSNIIKPTRQSGSFIHSFTASPLLRQVHNLV